MTYPKTKDPVFNVKTAIKNMVSIGGLDPNKMFNGILSALVQKGVLSQSEAQQIVDQARG